MSDSVQEQLLGHLLGALDDAEQNAVEVRLESDPEFRQELARMHRRLELLEEGRCSFLPSPGLAQQTCRLVVSHSRQHGPQTLLPEPAPAIPPYSREPPSWVSRVRWIDVAMAAGVFVAAALLTVRAIQHSRFHWQIVACQNNLREVGQAMKQYADVHNGYFPSIPTKGKLAAAGIYAPTLMADQLLSDVHWVVCPGSPLAEQGRFRIPSLSELQSASPEELARLRARMGGSYGYHLGYVADGSYRGTKDLNRSNFGLMADAPGTIIPGRQSDNHGGRGQNVLFEDGRVVFLPTSRLTPEAEDFFTNDDGLVAAGTHVNDSVIGASSAVPITWVKGGR